MTRDEKRGFYRELWALAIPISVQNLLMALVGATDALMLGRLAQDAVAAVSLANQISFIMSLFISAVVGGGGALIAQYWGKNDHQTVKNLFCLMIKCTSLVSLAFFALAFFLPDRLMRIYTPEPALIEIGASYLKVVSFSYLFNGVTHCYYLMMKVSGRAAKSVAIAAATVIADIVLDHFLIYGIAGKPGAGANGSAYSTIAVEAIALIWCAIESCRPGNIHPDKAGMLWFSAAIAKDAVKIALPILAGALAWGLGFSMHSLIMGHLGSDATAAASITSVVQELVTCICKGVSAGSGIMIGKLLGQNLFDRAKAYGKAFWNVSFWVGSINIALVCLIGPVVTAFFILTDAARRYLVFTLVFSAVYLFAYSFNTIIVCGVFPAGGDSKYDAVSVVLSTWCFALPLALLGTFVFHWPVMLVYVLMCSDEIIKLPWLYPRYKKYLWLRDLTREKSGA